MNTAPYIANVESTVGTPAEQVAGRRWVHTVRIDRHFDVQVVVRQSGLGYAMDVETTNPDFAQVAMALVAQAPMG
jgi:hypothetical protein